MSDLPAGALSYSALVAEYFLGLRGSGLMLSPLDEELVAAWERRGIPVPVVCRGLKAAHAALLAERAPGSPPPRALRAYAFGVEQEWKAVRPGRVGSSPPPPPEDQAAARRLEGARALLEDLGRSADGPRREAYRGAWRALAAAEREMGRPTLAGVEAALAAADRALFRAFVDGLPRPARAALGARLRLRAGARPPTCARRAWRE
ncbi:MAG TPA: hypothetical protein VH880_10830, partial [Anaeromyxobacteraceae bacterium]